ncbi:cupin domain-containing protein [Gordonia sp. HNM0687]|uniref:Cupin domain-containing protein n=1 Tax=Gordonia mangrovi TaxID=2665643 RepID=A0A6L7GXY6_9ACTN|nr:cupin domain-containing protein [Gordonia mangrovi]MXP23525.1 cupin domain-containing protein [Gordonia mangrovi]UVF76580.1 cupin domain-containing protein [Gordonia mangrovi]
MHHPDTARVVVTRVEDDGTSDYYERTVEALTEYDADQNPLFKGSLLWGTSEGIGTVGPGQNPEPETDPFFPPVGGVRFVFFTFLPKSEGSGDIDRYRVEDTESASDMPGLAESFSEDRPGMHITDSIDFVHVLSGEMILELDRREVLVKKGDTIIMRGAWHNWRNEGTEPCTVASVLVGTTRTESGEGSATTESSQSSEATSVS